MTAVSYQLKGYKEDTLSTYFYFSATLRFVFFFFFLRMWLLESVRSRFIIQLVDGEKALRI